MKIKYQLKIVDESLDEVLMVGDYYSQESLIESLAKTDKVIEKHKERLEEKEATEQARAEADRLENDNEISLEKVSNE